MRKLATSIALTLISSQALAGNHCVGTFSDVSFSNASGDGSGLEVRISPTNAASVTVYEGSVETTKAKNIQISGNLIKFVYFQNKFFGQCSKNGISFSDTGGHKGLLRRKG